MIFMTTMIALLLTIGTPLLLHFGFKMSGVKLKYALIGNIVCFAVICIAATVILLNGGSAFALPEAGGTTDAAFAYIGAALATGLASIGAGIAVAASAASAIGAISEDSSIMGKALIFVALAEGIALYGLLISFTIIGRI
jgi:V/A-type H+-transporting ATPase subunit K